MKNLLLIGAVTAICDVSGAAAAELPTFELMGFPITAHQVAVVGAAKVQEQAPTPSLTFSGMPASPHQIAVLAPRRGATAQTPAVKLTTVGSPAR